MERMIDYDYKPQERRDLEELYKKQNVRVNELEQENKKLKDKIKRLEFDVDAWHQLKLLLEGEIEGLKEENRKLREELDKYKKQHSMGFSDFGGYHD